MPTLHARGVELSWSDRGSGRPALLIHETGTGAAVWDGVGRELEDAGLRAVAYDRRGWGASTLPQGYARTTVEEQAEDAAAMLAGADAVPAALCGAGLGAIVALELAVRRPALVTGAVLVEPPALGLVPEATERLSEDRVALRDAVNDGGLEAATELYLSGALEAVGPGASRLPAGLVEGARRDPTALLAELGAATAWAMPLALIREAERPVLIVTGPSTPALVRAASDALARLLAGSDRRELGGGTGPPHLDEPSGLAGLVGEPA